MITIKLPITLSEKDKKKVLEIQKQQSSVVRAAHSMLSRKNMKQKNIREEFKNYNLGSYMDSWFVQSGIYKGMELFENDKSKKVKQKRIFGGKKNLKDYINKKITKEEYKARKLSKIISIGEAPNKGNRKFSFFAGKVIFKPNKDTKITINLPSLRKNYNDSYNKLMIAAQTKKLPITIGLDTNFIYITYDEQKLNSVIRPDVIKGRSAAIDVNPRYIGLSVCDYDVNGNQTIIDTKIYSLNELIGKNKSSYKISHETIEIAHDIGRWLYSMGVENLFLEDLSFKNTNLGNRNVNRDINNQWKRNVFTRIVSKYYDVNCINAVYTSTIGNIRNSSYPDPIAASLEIGRRGYGWINRLKNFYPDLMSRGKLEELWKQTEFPDFKSWKEIHEFLKKNKGLKYRVPLPKEESFRKFSSYKSNCLVLNCNNL